MSNAERSEGFLGTFLSKGLKTNQLELNTDEKTLRPIARLKEPRDLFALPKNKDHEFALQAPRWPIECQVLDERIIHVIDSHLRPEPYNTPGGLKPRPVGEENGVVVFNYNPISPVNYEKPKAKFRDSSDSDISSSESRNSSPERRTPHDGPLKAEVTTSFTKLISDLSQRSSSNSNDDDDYDTEDVLGSPNDSSITTPMISESSHDDNNIFESTNNINDKDNNNQIGDTVTQTSDGIDDIWANNSTEYPPATPVFTKMPPSNMDSQQLIELSKINGSNIIPSTEGLVLSVNDGNGDGDKKGGDTIHPADNMISDECKQITTELLSKSGTELGTDATTEPVKKPAPKLETELVIRSITATVTVTASGGNDDAMTTTDSDRNKDNAERDVELRVKTPILNEDVLKLYNDIISISESNKSEPSSERKTNRVESKSDNKQDIHVNERKTKRVESKSDNKQDTHVINERKTKMYLDLNVEEDNCKNARDMFFARKSQDVSELNSDSLSVPQFSRSAISGSRILNNCHPCSEEDYDGLEFESRFESGNLAKAVKITKNYYELYLRPDLYTNRSKQWFYFRVQKTRKDIIYRFSIVNLVKADSLYNEGMRPLMYSTTRAKNLREGWRRCGENVCYYRNDDENTTTSEEDDDSLYTLTFNIEFPHDDDTVYLAHSYPYTYSDLQDYLMGLQKHPVKSKFCKLRILCRTLAGNNVYYLTVTAPPKDEEIGRRKKSIVISARVHPSETPASWMMKGLMDYITGETWIAKRLRNKFVFKLIPMLNPDGVIVGNTRNSLTGKDLNRQYRTVIRETYPSIWYTKALVKRLIDECGVAMYCDMHAHSRKQNIFLYGCENRRNPEKKLTEQVFPLMMHKNSADTFSFESCKFKVQRNKEGTGRIVVWMLGITNSYTIEASFGGSSLGSRRGTHFNTAERLRLKIIERLLKEGSSAEDPLNIPLSDYSSDEGHASSDSESENKSLTKPSDFFELSPKTFTSLNSNIQEHKDKRQSLYRRMRKVMHELDRIYFQPLFHKKYQQFLKFKQGKQKNLKKKLLEKKLGTALLEKARVKENNDRKLKQTPNQTQSNQNKIQNLHLDLNKNQIPNQNQVQNLNADNSNQNQSTIQNPNSNLVQNSKTENSNLVPNQNTNAQNQNKTTYQIVNQNHNLNQVPIQNTLNQTQSQNESKDSQPSTSQAASTRKPKTPLDTVNQNQRVKVSRNLRLFLETRKIMIVRKRKKKPRKLLNKGARARGKDGTRTAPDIPTTDPTSDVLFSTDDELYGDQMRMRRDLHRRYTQQIGYSSFFLNHTPPELVITSPPTLSKFETRRDGNVEGISLPPTTAPTSIIKNYPELRLGRDLLSMRRTSSWHNLHGAESVRKTKTHNQYQNPLKYSKDDLQLRLSLMTKHYPDVAPESPRWLNNNRPTSTGTPQTTVTNLFSELKTENFASTSSNKSREWTDHEAFFKACSDKILNLKNFSALLTSSTSATRTSITTREKRGKQVIMPEIHFEERTVRAIQQIAKLNSESHENPSVSSHSKARGPRKKKQSSPTDTNAQILSRLSKSGKSRSSTILQRLKCSNTPTHINPIHVKRTNDLMLQQRKQRLPSNWANTSKFKTAVQSTNMRRSTLLADVKLPLQQTVPTVVAILPKTRSVAPSQQTTPRESTGKQIAHSVKRKFKAQKNTASKALTPVKPGGEAAATFSQASPTTMKPATVAGERVQIKLKKVRDAQL